MICVNYWDKLPPIHKVANGVYLSKPEKFEVSYDHKGNKVCLKRSKRKLRIHKTVDKRIKNNPAHPIYFNLGMYSDNDPNFNVRYNPFIVKQKCKPCPKQKFSDEQRSKIITCPKCKTRFDVEGRIIKNNKEKNTNKSNNYSQITNKSDDYSQINVGNWIPVEESECLI